MANKKISDLPASSALASPDLFELLQGGVNKKLTGAQLLAFFGAAAYSDGEVPAGLVNGSNTIFTLAFTPLAGSVHVYLNGLRMKATVDYNISGTTITFVVAPSVSDTILTDYRR